MDANLSENSYKCETFCLDIELLQLSVRVRNVNFFSVLNNKKLQFKFPSVLEKKKLNNENPYIQANIGFQAKKVYTEKNRTHRTLTKEKKET